jgi:hypothetical protein
MRCLRITIQWSGDVNVLLTKALYRVWELALELACSSTEAEMAREPLPLLKRALVGTILRVGSLIEGLQHLIPQAPILMLEPRLPLDFKVIPRVVDYLVEGRGFGGTSPAVLELLLCLFPCVAPEHTGWFGEVRPEVVAQCGMSADGDSG